MTSGRDGASVFIPPFGAETGGWKGRSAVIIAPLYDGCDRGGQRLKKRLDSGHLLEEKVQRPIEFARFPRRQDQSRRLRRAINAGPERARLSPNVSLCLQSICLQSLAFRAPPFRCEEPFPLEGGRAGLGVEDRRRCCVGGSGAELSALLSLNPSHPHPTLLRRATFPPPGGRIERLASPSLGKGTPPSISWMSACRPGQVGQGWALRAHRLRRREAPLSNLTRPAIVSP